MSKIHDIWIHLDSNNAIIFSEALLNLSRTVIMPTESSIQLQFMKLTLFINITKNKSVEQNENFWQIQSMDFVSKLCLTMLLSRKINSTGLWSPKTAIKYAWINITHARILKNIEAVHSYPHLFTTQEYSLTFIHSQQKLVYEKKKKSSTETALIIKKKKS